jgi:hypothetical protein
VTLAVEASSTTFADGASRGAFCLGPHSALVSDMERTVITTTRAMRGRRTATPGFAVTTTGTEFVTAIAEKSYGPDHPAVSGTSPTLLDCCGRQPADGGRAAYSACGGDRREELRPRPSPHRDPSQQSRFVAEGYQPTERVRTVVSAGADPPADELRPRPSPYGVDPEQSCQLGPKPQMILANQY